MTSRPQVAVYGGLQGIGSGLGFMGFQYWAKGAGFQPEQIQMAGLLVRRRGSFSECTGLILDRDLGRRRIELSAAVLKCIIP